MTSHRVRCHSSKIFPALPRKTIDVQSRQFEAARSLEPSSPSVRFHLARAYQRAGRTADAERERTEFRRLEKLQQIRRGGANAAGGDLQEENPQ